MQSHAAGQSDKVVGSKFTSEILIKHEEIDKAIQHEKNNVQSINKKFAILDVAAVFFLLTVYIVLTYLKYGEDKKFDNNATFETIFDLLFGCSLAGSAIYLSNFMTKATGKK